MRSHEADYVPPLPHCVGAEAVDEEEIRLFVLLDFRGPAVHHGAVFEVCGGGSEPRFQKGGSVAGIFDIGDAEAPRHLEIS